jgi:hypothetical protein
MSRTTDDMPISDHESGPFHVCSLTYLGGLHSVPEDARPDNISCF